MKHEHRSVLLEDAFRKADEPQQGFLAYLRSDAPALLSLIAIALFIGAAAIWLQLFIDFAGD